MGLKAVHFGGGNIGRGFVAEKLVLAGYEVVFVDVMDSIIEQLQKTKEYTVTEIGGEGEKVNTISNYRAINSKTHEADVIEEICTADLVTCAVGPNILKFIAPVIGKAIDKRTAPKPLAVIACENAIGATDTLAGFIKDSKNTPQDRLSSINDRASFANSAIDRIVPGQDPNAGLNVKIESFYEWVVDKTPFAKEGHPEISAIKWVDDLNPYIERKLFTVNTGHAAAAYYGHARGKRTIHDALQDSEINKIVYDCLAETSHLIVKKHGISTEEQKAYVEKIVKRISNPYLEDVVERVGRAPLRKLSRKERFVGPASQLAESGDKIDALLGAIEQAFAFLDVKDDEESAELSKTLKSTEAKEVVTKVCGLEESHPLFKQIVPIVEKVQKSINQSSKSKAGANPLGSKQDPKQSDASSSAGSVGIGMGHIEPRFLAREKWPLNTPQRLVQYHKFVQLMINRIRAGESNDEETARFTALIDHSDDWQYMLPACGMLPELGEAGPLATNTQMSMMVGHVNSVLDARHDERIRQMRENQLQQPQSPQTAEAITADAREKIAKSLFGPTGESNATPKMKNLLTSWVNTGYPGKVLEKVMALDSKRSRGMNRDDLGLPYGLREHLLSYWYAHRKAQKNPPPDPPKPKQNVPQRREPPPSGHAPSGEEAVRANENAHEIYNPGNSDSPPTSENPPEYLLRESTDLNTDSADGNKDVTTEPPRTCYRDFVTTHCPDYRGDVGPLPRKPHGDVHINWKRPVLSSTKVTDEGTVVTMGFTSQDPATSDAILREIDSNQLVHQKKLEQEEQLASQRRQDIEEPARQKKQERAANHGESHAATETSLPKTDLKTGSGSDPNGCAIEDTTSESERDLEIRPKSKTPLSAATPATILSNPSTGPPTLTTAGSPKTSEAADYVDKGVNLQQVNQRLQKDEIQVERDDVGQIAGNVSSSNTAVWEDYLKSIAEYAKERARAEGVMRSEGGGGSGSDYDAGGSGS
ncbi:MAG: hypothetical protein Q9169_007226 [Polycauliona sp. 2 TL-2023]